MLPAAIPLEAQNFSVPEGGARTLVPPLLRIAGSYFPRLPALHLQVLEPPRHGALQREEGPQDGSLSAFAWREVRSGTSPGQSQPPKHHPTYVGHCIMFKFSLLALGMPRVQNDHLDTRLCVKRRGSRVGQQQGGSKEAARRQQGPEDEIWEAKRRKVGTGVVPMNTQD